VIVLLDQLEIRWLTVAAIAVCRLSAFDEIHTQFAGMQNRQRERVLMCSEENGQNSKFLP
jgi:hypothetical protein